VHVDAYRPKLNIPIKITMACATHPSPPLNPLVEYRSVRTMRYKRGFSREIIWPLHLILTIKCFPASSDIKHAVPYVMYCLPLCEAVFLPVKKLSCHYMNCWLECTCRLSAAWGRGSSPVALWSTRASQPNVQLLTTVLLIQV
jgi:hypothetical protein